MGSLRNHYETLEDFCGFFDTNGTIPRFASVDNLLLWFSNTRTLSVDARFLAVFGSVTHLSVRLKWEAMPPAVRSLSTPVGYQVCALRLERKSVPDGGRF